MTKEEKKKLLADFEQNAMYHTALQSLTNSNDRRQIKAFVDDVYINLVESLTSILSSTQEIESEDESTTIPNE